MIEDPFAIVLPLADRPLDPDLTKGASLPQTKSREYLSFMKNLFTAYVQREGEWFIATSPEVPEANGQGHSKEECLHSLAAAIELVFEERRASARNELKSDAEEALVAVG